MIMMVPDVPDWGVLITIGGQDDIAQPSGTYPESSMPIMKVAMARSKARLDLGCAICLARINWQLAWSSGGGSGEW